MEFRSWRGPVVYAERAGEGASAMVTSGFPVRDGCGVALEYSNLVLLVFRDRDLMLGAAGILLVIVPTLLG
jgi:hypothetical protein